MFRKSGKKGSKIIQNAEEFEESVNLVKVDLPKKRGISASLLGINEEPQVAQKYSCKKFVKEKTDVEKIREKNFEKHLKKNLDSDGRSDDFVIPDKYKPDNSRIVDGTERTLWLAGLVEVPLSIEHKIDNIEATEAAKRKMIGTEEKFVSRFEHLHQDEFDVFNSNMTKSKNLEKEIERLEKNMILRGKRYKIDKEERVRLNRKLEESWKM